MVMGESENNELVSFQGRLKLGSGSNMVKSEVSSIP
jgi:hypothetical protein